MDNSIFCQLLGFKKNKKTTKLQKATQSVVTPSDNIQRLNDLTVHKIPEGLLKVEIRALYLDQRSVAEPVVLTVT